jgi:hypothetical protein
MGHRQTQMNTDKTKCLSVFICVYLWPSGFPAYALTGLSDAFQCWASQYMVLPSR